MSGSRLSPDRITEVMLFRRVEKALLRHARAHWAGTRDGLKHAVRRYVRRSRDTDLVSLLRSSARAATAASVALLLCATSLGASSGKIIFGTAQTNPFHLSNQPRPAFADLDGNGVFDLLSGMRSGAFMYFENTGVHGSPVFASPLINPFGLTTIGDDSAPAFGDLDHDGDLDLISGTKDTVLVYFENKGSTTNPLFTSGVDNPFGLSGFGGRSVPALGDLDQDGDLDLMCGLEDGAYMYFENTGTPSSPAFVSPLSNPFGLNNLSKDNAPVFVDLDGDGDCDLVSGDASGTFVYFQNTGSATSPAFAAAVSDPFGLKGEQMDSAPAFVDLEGDGDFDLVSGDVNGAFAYFENTGSARTPAFADSVFNPFQWISLRNDPYPALGDLDEDGDPDLICGQLGINFLYFQNTGSSSDPAFAPAVSNPFGLTISHYAQSPVLCDLDGDGDFDLMCGNRGGSFVYYQNTGSKTVPAFAPALTNPFGLWTVGDTSGRSAPALANIDGDDDLDLLSGDGSGGFTFFTNTGSATSPAFVYGGILDSNGGITSTPAFGDLDQDGDFDVMSGDISGNFTYYQNTGSPTHAAFVTGVSNPFGLSSLGSQSMPSFGDLDADHDLDVLSGSLFGSFIYFPNDSGSP